MNHPQCVITGATFFDPVGVRWVRCDLHRIGDCYIANCNTVAGGNTAWEYGQACVADMLVSAMQGVYYERRGIIVFTKDVAVFNDRAEDYLKRTLGQRNVRGL